MMKTTSPRNLSNEPTTPAVRARVHKNSPPTAYGFCNTRKRPDATRSKGSRAKTRPRPLLCPLRVPERG